MPYADSVSSTRWADRTSLSLTSFSLGAADLGVEVGFIQFGGKEFRRARQTQVKIGPQTDLDRAPGQPVIECVSAVLTLRVDEVGMVARHRNTLFVLRHPESGQRAGDIGETQLLLLFSGLGERWVGLVLLGDRAGTNRAEIAADADGN